MTHIPKILIKTIDPGNQRFGECGDWFYDAEGDTLTIFVNRMPDWKSKLKVAIHEFYEAVAFLANDGDQTDVDFFDKKFYQEHDEGQAGDDSTAPYYREHCGATLIEKEVLNQAGISWADHEKNCEP